MMTLYTVRVIVLIYSLVNSDNHYIDYTMNDEIIDFFYFEIPFDFIISASMVQFFQWYI